MGHNDCAQQIRFPNLKKIPPAIMYASQWYSSNFALVFILATCDEWRNVPSVFFTWAGTGAHGKLRFVSCTPLGNNIVSPNKPVEVKWKLAYFEKLMWLTSADCGSSLLAVCVKLSAHRHQSQVLKINLDLWNYFWSRIFFLVPQGFLMTRLWVVMINYALMHIQGAQWLF